MKQQKRTRIITFLIRQLEEDKDSETLEFEALQKLIVDFTEFFSFALKNGYLKSFDASSFQHIFQILSRQIELYKNRIITIATNKNISSNAVESKDEEEKKEDPITPEEQKSSYKQLKEIFLKDPSLTLSLEQNSVQNFCEFISSVLTQFSPNDFEVFLNLVAQVCETLLLFLKLIKPNDKNACKNFLSFKLNFYYFPFMCLKGQGYDRKSILFLPEKYIPIIKVFSKVLFHTLRITDDEEFIANNEIVQSNWLLLNKEELIEIAGFSNQLLYNIIWDRMTSFYPVISAQVKLVRELHNRDGRIKFCPKDFWTIPELVISVEKMLQSTDQFRMIGLEEILNEFPHMLSFEIRVKFLHRFIEHDKLRAQYELFPENEEEERDPETVTIRRDYLLEDGFERISSRKNMRSKLKIQFVNELDLAEEGLDRGGILKEFITLLNKEVFDVKYGLFIENEDKTLMPSPNSDLNPEHLKLFNFIGRMTGKAIYEHILIDSMFSVIFLNRILRVPNTIHELKHADPLLYKNLMLLKHGKDVAEKLGLTFSIDEMAFGQQRTHLLKPNGDKIDVNESNKLEYISLYCEYKLNKQIDRQSLAFLDGLRSTIDLTWIRLFNHEELQHVISGFRREGFDVADLKENVGYIEYEADSQTILAFWEVIEEMSDEERSLFLLFTTACSRPPTLGFTAMYPKIVIQNSSIEYSDRTRLPTAATCVNLLSLPDYESKEVLKNKLLYAIHANAGFERLF